MRRNRTRSRRKESNVLGTNVSDRRMNQEKRVAELLLPTAENQYSTTAVAHRDLKPALIERLLPFQTSGNKIYRIRQQYGTLPALVQVAGAPSFVSAYFALSGLDNSAGFGLVFDQYRIVAIEVSISPQATSQPMASGVTFPRLYTAIDYDDAATPTSIAYVREYDSCVESPPGSGIVRTFTPAMALAAYSGAFTSYANRSMQWIDVASPNVQHYGIKAACDGGQTGQTLLQQYDVDAVIFVEFRNVR